MDFDVPSDPYALPKAELAHQTLAPRRTAVLSVVRTIAIIGNVLMALVPFFALFAMSRPMRVSNYLIIAIIIMFVSSSLMAIWLRNRVVAWAAVVINGVVALLLLNANLGIAHPSTAVQVANVVIGTLVGVNLFTVAVDVLMKNKSQSGK